MKTDVTRGGGRLVVRRRPHEAILMGDHKFVVPTPGHVDFFFPSLPASLTPLLHRRRPRLLSSTVVDPAPLISSTVPVLPPLSTAFSPDSPAPLRRRPASFSLASLLSTAASIEGTSQSSSAWSSTWGPHPCCALVQRSRGPEDGVARPPLLLDVSPTMEDSLAGRSSPC
jgi:hypothetical protein